ncbi:MAG: hypothetical protein AB1391_02655 [Candidatus Micrarchaeota archaeon]
MKPITLVLNDRVGLISDLSYILGKEKINIDALSASVVGKKIVITIQVKNNEKAVAVLAKNGYTNIDKDYDIIMVKNQPGELSKVTGLLKKARINIENLFQISQDSEYAMVSLKTNKPRLTKEILKPYLAERLL